MLPRCVELFKTVKTAHAATYRLIKMLMADLQSTGDVRETADMVYAAKDAQKFAEDTVKELRGLIELVEKVTCILYVKAGSLDVLRTDHCTATPRVGMMASLPRRKTDFESYKKLMDFLKVPENLWHLPEGERGPVDFDWKGITQLLTDRAEQGLPLPPGIDPSKTYPVYRVTCHPRKEVDAKT